MGPKKNGQVAIEFLILMGFILSIFVMVIAAVSQNMSDKIQERKNLRTKEIAIQVQDEINLAIQSIDGYERKFNVPSDIHGEEFEIGFADDFVYVRTIDKRHAISLPIQNVTGDIIQGENIITKKEGEIYLNE